MPIDWQHMSVPLGQGLETRASEKVLPPGKLTKAVNVSFKTPGAISKRAGLADDLGLGQTKGDALAVLGDHLLARANGNLFDYQPNAKPGPTSAPIRNPNQAWKNLGPLRAAPASAQIVKGSLDGVQFTDAYCAGNLRCVIWADEINVVTVRILDEATGAIISEKALGVKGASNQVVGVVSEIAKFFVLIDWTLWIWTSATNSWSSQNVAQTQTAVPATIGDVAPLNARTCVCGTDIIILYALTGGVLLVRETFTGNLVWSVRTAALPCIAGPVSVSVSADNTSVLVAITAEVATVKGLYGGIFDATTGIVQVSSVLDVIYDPTSGLYNHGGAVLATTFRDIQRVTVFPYSGRAAFVWDRYSTFSTDWYADGLESSFNKLLMKGELTPHGDIINHDIWLRGLSLASDGMAVPGASVLWATYSQASLTQLSTGSAEVTALNAVDLLVDYATSTVCAKLLAQQALEQASVAHISQGLRGITSALLSVSKADTVKLELQRATVALLTVDFSAERLRSSTAQKDLVLIGGSPSDFDGTALTEQGFFAYPEFRVIGKKAREVPTSGIGNFFGSNYLFPYPGVDEADPFTVYARFGKTWYSVGDIVPPSLSPLASSHGRMLVALTSGFTGAAAPIWPVQDGNILDGDVVWGVYYFDKLPLGWRASFGSYNSDSLLYIPEVRALLQITGTTLGGTTGATPPIWSSFKEGDSIIDGGYTYLWVNTVDATVYRNGVRVDASVYMSGICAVYEWVDDSGQLHQSLPSVVQSVPIMSEKTGTTTLGMTFYAFRYSYLISTLRTTRKTNVYIAIYRTADDGTLLQKIGQILNDPTVDAVVFNDDISDTTQSKGILLYAGQNGAGELPNEQACSCSLIQRWGQRVVTNDLENKGQIRASKLLADGYGPAWSSELVIPVTRAFGDVTAFATMDDKLIIFHAEHIGILSGDGPSNTGAGQAFPNIEYLMSDVGCVNPDSVVATPDGLMFQSGKGIFKLNRGLEVGYAGASVENPSTSYSYAGAGIGLDMPLDAPLGDLQANQQVQTISIGNIVSADVAPKSTEVRFLTDTGTVLVYDYVVNEWSVWTYGGADALTFNNEYVILTKTGQVFRETPSYHVDAGGLPIAVAFKLAAIRLDGVQGFGKLRHVAALLESNAPTTVEFKIYDDYSVNSAQETAQFALNGSQQLRVRPTHAKLQAFGLEFIEVPTGDADLKVTGIDALVGLIGKLNRVPSSNRLG